MKSLLNKAILISSLILFFNCSKDDSGGNNIPIEPLNEFGLLEFKIFSNPNLGFDKVLEGSDDTFNYFGYGDSMFSAIANKNVPKVLSKVVQFNPDDGTSIEIEVDANFIPIRFESEEGSEQNRIIYSVYYNENITEITVEEQNSDGTLNFVELITLSGFPHSEGRQNSVNNEDCSEEILPENNSFNICADGNIYEQYGNDWENNSGRTTVRNVGKFINWIVKTFKQRVCPNDDTLGRGYVSGAFSCDELEEPLKSYIRFLDTGEVLRFSNQVNITTNPNCSALRTYYINTEISCDAGESYGWPDEDNKEFMTISVNLFQGIYYANAFWKCTTSNPRVWDFDQGIFTSIQESQIGISLIGYQAAYYNGNSSPVPYDVNRPIELVFRF